MSKTERALQVLKSYPTPELIATEGFCMASFYSLMVEAACDILEGNEGRGC